MLKKIAIVLLLCVAADAQVTITGTFLTPNNQGMTGYLTVQLARSTVTNTCAPTQVQVFRRLTVQIQNGAMGPLSLYASACLRPSQPYIAYVFDNLGQLIYRAQWIVPSGVTSADVSQLGTNCPQCAPTSSLRWSTLTPTQWANLTVFQWSTMVQ